MAYSQAQKEWIKEHTTQIKISLHNVNDSDILDKLNSVENKQGYIKDLIRKDIGTFHRANMTQENDNCKKGKPLIDLTGQKIGRWTVLRRSENAKRSTTYWTCQCECGNIRDITSQALRSGGSQGCQSCKWKYGKYGTDESARMGADPERITNGKKTKAYATWQAIRARCYIKTHKSYHNYGGRGIKLCDEWYSDFHSFYQHVSNLPNYEKESYTLDRIDNEKGYEPGNVRWASRKEQSQNRRNVNK